MKVILLQVFKRWRVDKSSQRKWRWKSLAAMLPPPLTSATTQLRGQLSNHKHTRFYSVITFVARRNSVAEVFRSQCIWFLVEWWSDGGGSQSKWYLTSRQPLPPHLEFGPPDGAKWISWTTPQVHYLRFQAFVASRNSGASHIFGFGILELFVDVLWEIISCIRYMYVFNVYTAWNIPRYRRCIKLAS